MEIGMLWFDNDKKTDLTTKVGRAAAHYQKKYGQRPNLCFVNPAALNGSGATACGGVEVRTSKTILPHHFWVGVKTDRIDNGAEA